LGTKYSSQSTSGYNSSPPVDDGTASEANKVKWSTIKTKLADVLKTFGEAINSALVTALDQSCRTVAASDSAAATDHNRAIQVTTSSVTITLADATTMAAGYIVSVANQSSGNISIALATATDTIDGVTNTTQVIHSKEVRRYIVNTAATGYITASSVRGMAPITASLGADVAMNNIANYFDGPSIAQGSVGTWFVSGSVVVDDTAGAAVVQVKLWDGTTVIASGRANIQAASNPITVSLSGYLANPAGNLRISCKDTTSTSGQIRFNQSGESKDSTISAIRIA
jgi:hypothetical protein